MDCCVFCQVYNIVVVVVFCCLYVSTMGCPLFGLGG